MFKRVRNAINKANTTMGNANVLIDNADITLEKADWAVEEVVKVVQGYVKQGFIEAEVENSIGPLTLNTKIKLKLPTN